MKDQLQRSRVPAVILCVLVAVMIALICLPGVIYLFSLGGRYELSNYDALFASSELFTLLALLLVGCVLIPLISFARKPNEKSITVAAVMLETAALLGVYQIVISDAFPPSLYKTLGYAIEACAVLAAILAFVLCRRGNADPGADRSARKRMAVFCLLIAAVFAATFVNRCWRWDFSDRSSYGSYFDNNAFLGCYFSAILTAGALNVALLHAVGLVRARPVGCALLLLGAGALSAYGIILHFASSGTTYSHCVPLPLTYLITALQLAFGFYLLLSSLRKRQLVPSPDRIQPMIG